MYSESAKLSDQGMIKSERLKVSTISYRQKVYQPYPRSYLHLGTGPSLAFIDQEYQVMNYSRVRVSIFFLALKCIFLLL